MTETKEKTNVGHSVTVLTQNPGAGRTEQKPGSAVPEGAGRAGVSGPATLGQRPAGREGAAQVAEGQACGRAGAVRAGARASAAGPVAQV